MPQLSKQINLEAFIDEIEASFDPEHSANDRRILHEVTGLRIDDGSSSDDDDVYDEDNSDISDIDLMTKEQLEPKKSDILKKQGVETDSSPFLINEWNFAEQITLK